MLTTFMAQTFGATSYSDIFFLLGIALIITSIGFYRVLYFINIGYAFAIVGMIIFITVRHTDTFSAISGFQNLFLAIWGLRLGIYLIQREFLAAYSKQKNAIHSNFAKIPSSVKAIIWLSVAALYVFMFSPSLFLLTEAPTSTTWLGPLTQWGGLLIMGTGLTLETLADKQKSAFKLKEPQNYCDVGLYRLVRCPNYLGEIIFWFGNWVIGIMFYTTPAHWVLSTLGIICITLIMMGSTKRLEYAQDNRYGDRPAYQEYIRTVPVLFPFLPIYSLKKVCVILE